MEKLRKKATITDVARRANVSVSTVSRVINNNSQVKPDTKEKVLSAIEELNFEPNQMAQGLGSGKSNTIGLILPDITNIFFPSLARGVEDVASVEGFTVILGNSDNLPEHEDAYIKVLRQKLVDGIIIAGSNTEGLRIKEAIAEGLPIVLVDRTIPGLQLDSVSCDNLEGAYLAVSHLIRDGHENIIFLGGSPQISTTQEREKGYRRALQEYGLPVDAGNIYYGDFTYESGYDRTAAFLRERRDFTAIFAANDLLAIGAIRAIEEQGLTVPHDFSVIGFDDIFWASLEKPPLTTVAQPTYRMGMIACEILLERIRERGKGQKSREVILQPELVVRKSTAARLNR